MRSRFVAASASALRSLQISAPHVPAAKSAPKSAGRKRKASQQRPAATAAASPGASGSTQAAPPAKPSFADVVAGRTTPEQAVSVLISEVQRLTMEVSQVRAFGTRTYDQLQQEKQSSAERLEHLHRHSKRNNLVVFGVPESMALNTPAALACHMQGLLFQTPTGSELTKTDPTSGWASGNRTRASLVLFWWSCFLWLPNIQPSRPLSASEL